MKKIAIFLTLAMCLFANVAFAMKSSEPRDSYLSARAFGGISNIGYEAQYLNGATLWKETRKKPDFTFGGSVAIGWDFYAKHDFPVRVELEISGYSAHKVKQITEVNGGTEIKSYAMPVYLNMYYVTKPEKYSLYRYYVGGGVGVSLNNYTLVGTSTINKVKSSVANSFTAHVSCGVLYKMSSTLTLDAGLRAAYLGDFPDYKYANNIDKIEMYGVPVQASAYVGIQYNF